MVQVEDNSALVHCACAMPNKGDTLRTGILQSMAPAYIKLFEAMADYVRDNIKRSASPAIRRILAMDQLDHPHEAIEKIMINSCLTVYEVVIKS